MTNFDRIKAMNVGEFAAEFGEGCICSKVEYCPSLDGDECRECCLNWLESEVQDEAD